MKICPNCGHQNEDDFIFCEQCGQTMPESEIEAAEPEAAPEPVIEAAEPETAPEPEIETAEPEIVPEPVIETANAETAPAPAVEVPVEEVPAFCSNCGAPIQPGTRFCKQCGTPVYTAAASAASEPSDSPVKKAKCPAKGFLGTVAGKIVIGVAALIVIAVVVGIIILNTPRNKVLLGINNTFKGLSKTEFVQTVTNVANHGSVRVSGDIGTFGLDSCDITVKSNMKSNEFEAECNAEFANGNPLSASAWLSSDSVVVKSEDILGSGAYGIGLKGLSDNYKDSVFSSRSDSKYSGFIPSEIEDFLNEYEGAPDSKKYDDEIQTAFKKTAMEFSDLLFKYGKVKQDSDTVDFGETEAKVQQIILKIDEKAAKSIYKDMVKWLKKEESIKKLLKDMDDDPAMQYILKSGSYGNSLYDTWKKLLDSADPDVMRGYGDVEIIFGLKSGNLVQLRLEADGSDLELLIGPNPSKPDYIGISTPFGSDIYYAVETDNSQEYEAVICAGGEIVTIYWDKKNADLEIEADGDTLYGEMSRSGGKTDIQFEIPGTANEISITLDENDKPSSAPGFTDVLKMSEDDIDDLVDEVMGNMEYYIY